MALKAKAAPRKDITTGIADMQHRHFATVATIIRELPPFYDTCRQAGGDGPELVE